MTVLVYHGITSGTDFFAVKPKEFERQLEHLTKRYTVVPLERAFRHAAGEPATEDSVALTFDDGYKNFLTDAVPLLCAHNAPATVFVLSGTPGAADIGNDAPLLATEDFASVASSTIGVGSHGETHKKLAKLSYEEALREMRDSKRVIETQYGVPVRYLAYPKGSYNAQTMQAAERAGYKGAVSVVERSVKVGDLAYALPRVQIDASTSLADFKAKLTPAADWYYWLWSTFKRH